MRHPAHPDYHKGVAGRVCYDPATVAFVALSALKASAAASAATSAAKKQAKATIAEGNIAAANKAKQVVQKAATQRVSFLNSSLTLEGTPMNVIESTFNVGLEDIAQIQSNYNTKAKNQISAGKSAALDALIGGFTGVTIGGGSMGSFSDIGAGFSSMSQGYGFGTGFDISQSITKNPDIF